MGVLQSLFKMVTQVLQHAKMAITPILKITSERRKHWLQKRLGPVIFCTQMDVEKSAPLAYQMAATPTPKSLAGVVQLAFVKKET